MDVAAATPSLEETVASAESGLVEARGELEGTRNELERLTRLQHHHLSPLYDRLDQLELEIAEARAAMTGDPAAARRAYELRYGNQPVFDPLTDPLPEPEPEQPLIDPEYASTLRFLDPADSGADLPGASDAGSAVRRVFRELARRVHPDLAQEPAEKARRTEFIARVNDAYRRADLYELQRLAEEWTVIGAEGPERGSAERELWLRRRLIWLRARIAEARVERETLLSSPLGQVLAEFGAPAALEVLRTRLLDQIQVKQAELEGVYATGAQAAAQALQSPIFDEPGYPGQAVAYAAPEPVALAEAVAVAASMQQPMAAPGVNQDSVATRETFFDRGSVRSRRDQEAAAEPVPVQEVTAVADVTAASDVSDASDVTAAPDLTASLDATVSLNTIPAPASPAEPQGAA